MRIDVTKKSVFKSVLFVLISHGVSVINMLLSRNDVLDHRIVLVIQLLLCIITIPIYLFLKGNQSWGYTLLTLGSHIVFVILSCLTLSFFFQGWDTAIMYWTEIALCVTFGIVIMIDIFVNIKS